MGDDMLLSGFPLNLDSEAQATLSSGSSGVNFRPRLHPSLRWSTPPTCGNPHHQGRESNPPWQLSGRRSATAETDIQHPDDLQYA